MSQGVRFDIQAAMIRLAKYLLEGSTVGFAAYFIPQNKPSFEEVLLVAIVAAATFSVIDLFTSVAGETRYGEELRRSVRTGAGFGMGANLAGFPRA
jgi:hypothetical protein